MKRTLFFLFVLMMASSTMIMAQNQDIDTLFNESSNTLTAVPLVISNPALKTGFGVMGMYFFKFNQEGTISPPSTVNIIGLYSTNKNYFMAVISHLF